MLRTILFGTLLVAISIPVSASVDAGLLSLIPAGSKLITSIDVEQARSSDFGQYLMQRINTEDRDFEDLRRETGFDPAVDLQEFVFASPGSATSDSSPFLIVARGNFDVSRIEAAAKNKGGNVEKYQGIDLVVYSGGRNQQAFAFPESGIAAFGDVESVRAAIANRATPSVLDADTQRLISQAGAENDAWFVAAGNNNFLARHIGEGSNQTPEQTQALQSISHSFGGIHFGSVVQLSFQALTRSPKDASSLADVVRFVASIVQMQRQNDHNAAIVASALDNMDLGVNGATMHLSISLAEKSLEELAAGAFVSTGMNRPTPTRH